MKIALLGMLAMMLIHGCHDSDDIQRDQQEKLLSEGVAQTGMPAIKNFRERKLLKDILELRDQTGLVTYTYLANELPQPAPGHTALGGKLTYLGESLGYGIPYATQYTNPMKYSTAESTLPQADPNGLFSPTAAEGTWVMLRDPKGNVRPQYIEPRIVVMTFKLPSD